MSLAKSVRIADRRSGIGKAKLLKELSFGVKS